MDSGIMLFRMWEVSCSCLIEILSLGEDKLAHVMAKDKGQGFDTLACWSVHGPSRVGLCLFTPTTNMGLKYRLRLDYLVLFFILFLFFLKKKTETTEKYLIKLF